MKTLETLRTFYNSKLVLESMTLFECVYVCVTLCLISYIFTYHNYVTYVSYLFVFVEHIYIAILLNSQDLSENHSCERVSW
jgi:hypothetical protein